VCVVADRGMISAETIRALEARGIDYILGARERNSRDIQDKVLPDRATPTSVVVPRRRTDRRDIELQVRETAVDSRRYITCINPEEAAKDAAKRAAALEKLQAALKRGDKALLANRAYRRYLKTPEQAGFAIDPQRVAADARLDGVYVLRTNTTLSAIQVALQYRQLWKIEKIFSAAKGLLDTRPIFHQRDAAIRGHVFCSVLALILRKELEDRLTDKGFRCEWTDIVLDLDRLQDITVEQQGKRFLLRTATTGVCGKVFQATGVALPPTVRQISVPPPHSDSETVETAPAT
jgi:transposase